MSSQANLALVRIDAVDDRVERAVATINGIVASKSLEAAVEVGRYIVAEFYSGDLENFRAHGRKPVALREIAAHPDMRLSITWLSCAVAVGASVEELRDPDVLKLGLSHHRELLAVTDRDQRLELARRAMAESMTVREIRSACRGTTGTRQPEARSAPTAASPRPRLMGDRVTDEALFAVEAAHRKVADLEESGIEELFGEDRDTTAAAERLERAIETAVNTMHALRRLRASLRRRR